MRMSTVLMALFVGAVLYVLFGVPTKAEAWKANEVTAREKAAVADQLVEDKEKRQTLLDAAQWSVTPVNRNGMVRVVRFVSKPKDMKAIDRVYQFDTQGKAKFRATNRFGDDWKDNWNKLQWIAE